MGNCVTLKRICKWSKRYHEAIGLKGEMRFVGMDDTIELLAKEVVGCIFADDIVLVLNSRH